MTSYFFIKLHLVKKCFNKTKVTFISAQHPLLLSRIIADDKSKHIIDDDKIIEVAQIIHVIVTCRILLKIYYVQIKRIVIEKKSK